MTPRDLAFEDLKKIIAERSSPIVFWTGAGVSAPLPSWSGLLKHVIDVAKDKVSGIPNSKNLLATIESVKTERDLWKSFELLSSVEHGVGPESFRSAISKALNPSSSSDIPAVHSALWALRPRGIVTLNLDLFTLRAAATTKDKTITPIQVMPKQFGSNISIFKESRPFIAYPHGVLDEVDSWTFTSSSLSSRLNDAAYIAWVSALLATHTVIFVGITATDIAVGGLMDRISSQTGVTFRNNFWITHNTDVETDSWAEQRGIRITRYQVKGNDHSDLATMLKQFADFRPTENKDLEKPISPKHLIPLLESLPPPEEIDIRNKELLRKSLNGHALSIFTRFADDESGRDKEFRKFLVEYEEAVHNAYLTSTVEGRSEFLGYKLLAKANGGAFGVVYQAVDKLGQLVAIKILHSERLDNPEFYKNFRRGVNSLRILAERSVKGIVKFKDAVEIPPALVMQWVEGATLADAVFQPSLSSLHAKLEVLSQLATILQSSHSLPERVLHRDLRPANIMLNDFYTDDGRLEVIVLDFDLSWHRGAEDHSVMYSPAMGYLAPEQRRKINGASTRTSLVDSYGFGMVTYFMMSKRDPIPDQHLISLWTENLSQIANSTASPGLRCGPRRISRLIYNCTREDQSERWQMSQVRGELQSLIDYIERPEEVSSISVLAEELATNVEHMAGYVWNSAKSSADLQASSERFTSISADVPKRLVCITIDWMNAGTQDWSQINRLLEKGVPKMLEGLRSAGWNVNITKQARSFHISANLSADDIVGKVANHAKIIDKALATAFSMTGI